MNNTTLSMPFGATKSESKDCISPLNSQINKTSATLGETKATREEESKEQRLIVESSVETTTAGVPLSKQENCDWDIVLAELESGDNAFLETYIKRLTFDITLTFDEKGFSMLHHAVLKGVPGKVKFLINIAKSE